MVKRAGRLYLGKKLRQKSKEGSSDYTAKRLNIWIYSAEKTAHVSSSFIITQNVACGRCRRCRWTKSSNSFWKLLPYSLELACIALKTVLIFEASITLPLTLILPRTYAFCALSFPVARLTKSSSDTVIVTSAFSSACRNSGFSLFRSRNQSCPIAPVWSLRQ